MPRIYILDELRTFLLPSFLSSESNSRFGYVAYWGSIYILARKLALGIVDVRLRAV